jgi:hypothetical protein
LYSDRTFIPAPGALVPRWNPASPSVGISAPSRRPTSSKLLLKLTLPLCAVSTDFPSIHIGFPVPSYSQRKSDSKGHLSGLQKVQWSLKPGKPQQELAGPGIRASSQGGAVDFTKRTRKFLQGHVPSRANLLVGTVQPGWGFSIEFGLLQH